MLMVEVITYLYLGKGAEQANIKQYLNKSEITKETKSIFLLSNGSRINKERVGKYEIKVDGLGYVAITTLLIADNEQDAKETVNNALKMFFGECSAIFNK